MDAKTYGHFMQLCLLCLACVTNKTEGAELRACGGRFTRNIPDYDTLVPRKVDAEGAFQSYDLPHFYDLEEARLRSRRGVEEAAHVRYKLSLGGRVHVVELWPNHGFLSPGLLVERRRRDLWRGDPRLRRARREQCHYVGRVRGVLGSRAALSACLDGLVGYVHTGDDRYFVEPQAESRPDASGRHVHMAFRGDAASLDRLRRREQGSDDDGRFCGVHDQWQSAWQERFAREIQINPNFPNVLANPKNATFETRFLELLVVVDKKFIEFHKDHDSENYILTLMNMVSDYFHDASLGRSLEIVVVRIIYLEKEEEELDLTISPKAENTLTSFKTWAQRINPADPHHPNHHDVAVLITRYDICADNASTCSLLGLASMASACQPEHAACINEDSGLATGVTITHELGHVMGCAHDEYDGVNGPGCSPLAPDGTTYVMSAYMAPRTSVWSNCSMRFIGALLDSGMGECLLDEPIGHPYKGPDMPPGAMYDASYQCKNTLGSEEVCPWKKDELCRALWCKTSSTTCTTPGKPAADGTGCGEGKWCYAGECVVAGRRPAALDGAWGPWGAWSECSRSCGAGVEATERRCDSPAPQNKGRYCPGERKRFRVCNAEPCDPQQPTFREMQCSEYNDKPFSGKLYTWKTYTHAKGSECELLCYNDVPFYASLAPQVKDGTPCRKGSRDMCVSGQCMTVGCDWVLGSKIVEDMCGECGGDGSNCQLTEFVYNATNDNGYVVIAMVPHNSYNMKVEEELPSINTIAVSDKGGEKFYLNGNHSEYTNGEYSFGDAVGVYSHPEPERESLFIKGPTNEDLLVYAVFYGHPNPGIHVSYYVRNSTGYTPSYQWEFLEWGPCSSRCGGGSQISLPSCVEAKAGKVSDSFCNATSKPDAQNRACNQHKCPARWHTGPWSHCSGCLNHPGKQNRTVECRSDNPIVTGEPVLMEVCECSGERPEDSQSCHSDQPCEEQHESKENGTSAPLFQHSELTALGPIITSSAVTMAYLTSVSTISIHDKYATSEPSSVIAGIVSTSNKNFNLQEQINNSSQSNADHSVTHFSSSDLQHVHVSQPPVIKHTPVTHEKCSEDKAQPSVFPKDNTYQNFSPVSTSTVISKSELTSPLLPSPPPPSSPPSSPPPSPPPPPPPLSPPPSPPPSSPPSSPPSPPPSSPPPSSPPSSPPPSSPSPPPSSSSSSSTSASITSESKAIPVLTGSMHPSFSPETAVDRVSESQIILKEATLIGALCNKSLSEKAEREMGENLADTLDTSKEKIFKGKKALMRTKEIKQEQEKERKLPV